MNPCRLLRLVLFGWAITASALVRGAGDDRPIQVLTSLESVIPPALKPLLLDEPRVGFSVTIGEDGHLLDFLALRATHHDLLPRAEEVLQKGEFAPALVGGKPVQATAEVTVSFYDPEQRAYLSGVGAMPFGLSASDAASRRIYETSKERFVYRRAEPAELDQPLAVKEARLMVLTDPAGQPARGTCVVDFYVDRQGQPRAPRVVKTDNETVALSALLTLQHTRYQPPTRKGAPTYVKVRQPISYAPDDEEKPAQP